MGSKWTPDFLRPYTREGKDFALAKLKERRDNPPNKIDNGSLYAGSPMYYYCKSCGDLAAMLNECHLDAPPPLCSECQALKDCGWLE